MMTRTNTTSDANENLWDVPTQENPTDGENRSSQPWEPNRIVTNPDDVNEDIFSKILLNGFKSSVQVQDQTSDKQSLKSLVQTDLPEIVFLYPLDLKMPLRSEQPSYVATGCQLLLEKFDEIRFNRYGKLVYTECEVALRPTDGNSDVYQLFLRIDGKKWYDEEGQFDHDIASKAQTYIDRVKVEEGFSPVAVPRKVKEKPCYRPVICSRGADCGFFACDKHTIYMEKGAWHAVTRCNKTRVVTICPTEHCSNKQWVVTKKAWQTFFKVVHRLQYDLALTRSPFERVFIHFGGWQSSPLADHAHINMVLTNEAIQSADKEYPHCELVRLATETPTNYRLSDAYDLEESIRGEYEEKEATECNEERGAPDLVSSDISIEIYAKSSIIQCLNKTKHGKANKILYDL